MSATPWLSVIIPTYRRCASLERELRALTRQTLAPETYEVIVSIDGSEDGTRERVAAYSAPYRLCNLWQPNRGRAAACNAGIQIARGEVLVILDDDMEPAPECLETHWRAHSSDPRLGVIGAAPVCGEGNDPPVATYIATKFNQHLNRLSQPNHRWALRDFYSGHFSIRRDVLVEVGLFDEAFSIYGNEDLELSLRLTKFGVRLAYVPEALAYQHYSKDFAALAQDTMAKGRTAVLLVSKHPEALPELQLSTYARDSWRWRSARTVLLASSLLWSSIPKRVITVMHWLERRKVKQLSLCYRFALDYLYWLGVKTALRENRRSGQGLTALVNQGKE